MGKTCFGTDVVQIILEKLKVKINFCSFFLMR